jgi:hypothetical protein
LKSRDLLSFLKKSVEIDGHDGLDCGKLVAYTVPVVPLFFLSSPSGYAAARTPDHFPAQRLW